MHDRHDVPPKDGILAEASRPAYDLPKRSVSRFVRDTLQVRQPGRRSSVTLATLLRPVEPLDVIDALEVRRFRHFSCDETKRRRSLLDWDGFVEILNLYTTNDVRVTKSGRNVPAEWLRGPSDPLAQDTAEGQPEGSLIDGRRFAELARQGISVILNRAEQKSLMLRALCQEASDRFGCPAKIGLIATFGAGRALPPHFDTQDLIVVQLLGAKEWEILGPPRDLPLPRRGGVGDNSLASACLTMREGDVLAVPRGLAHRCNAMSPSLHLGILLSRMRPIGYLRWLVEQAQGLAEFDAPASFVASRAQRELDERGLYDAIRRLTGHFPPSAYRQARRRDQIAAPVTRGDLPVPAEDGETS